jgi:DNA modification methylase
MGKFRLYQGDTLETLKTFASGSVDAIVTDPPYDVNLTAAACAWDIFPSVDVWKELYRVTKPDGLMAFTIAPRIAHERVPIVTAAGWHVLETGFWIWGSGRPVSNHRLKRSYDLVYFMTKTNRSLFSENARGEYAAGSTTGQTGTMKRANVARATTDDYKVARKPYQYGKNYFPADVALSADMPETERRAIFGASQYDLIFAVKRLTAHNRTNETHHPTEKPLDLMTQIVKLVSNPGDTVLEPFAGSGTSGLAAAIEDRIPLMIERNSLYCRFIETKFQEYSLALDVVSDSDARAA